MYIILYHQTTKVYLEMSLEVWYGHQFSWKIFCWGCHVRVINNLFLFLAAVRQLTCALVWPSVIRRSCSEKHVETESCWASKNSFTWKTHASCPPHRMRWALVILNASLQLYKSKSTNRPFFYVYVTNHIFFNVEAFKTFLLYMEFWHTHLYTHIRMRYMCSVFVHVYINIDYTHWNLTHQIHCPVLNSNFLQQWFTMSWLHAGSHHRHSGIRRGFPSHGGLLWGDEGSVWVWSVGLCYLRGRTFRLNMVCVWICI